MNLASSLTILLFALTPIMAAENADKKSDWPASAQKLIKQYPHGNTPKFTYTAPKAPAKESVKEITFFENAKECKAGKGKETITIKKDEFSTSKKCASDCGSDTAQYYFKINGNLGGCQINWYSTDECNPKDWQGYLPAPMQHDGCMQPLDKNLKPIKGLPAFKLICPEK